MLDSGQLRLLHTCALLAAMDDGRMEGLRMCDPSHLPRLRLSNGTVNIK